MKNFYGRQHKIWILLCIFGCVDTEAKAIICNRHEREHSRTLDDKERTAGQSNIEALPYGYNIIEHPNHKDEQNKEYQSQIRYSFNTKDDKYNHNTNTEEVIPELHDITTIYLAGYDDQIINLMNDIQSQGTGCEVLIYFYLFTNNDFRNIGTLYTNNNILQDCITRYNHYFCVGHNSNYCSCLSNVKSNNKQIVEIKPEVKKGELHKVDHTDNTSGQEFNTKADANMIHNTNNTSEFKVNYPEKQSTGSYEFILPKEKDAKFKDVFVDVVPKPLEVFAENKMVQNLDSVNIDAKHKVEIANNNVSGGNFASSLPKLDQQNIFYDLQGIPDAAIIFDPITISNNNLNNNLDYINGITDQRHTPAYDVPNINLPDTETSSLLQLKPGTNGEQVNIPVNHNQNVQLFDNSINTKPDVQKNPNLEPQNIILQKPTSLPMNVVPIDKTNEPKILNDEYITYKQNIPEQTFRNTDSVNQALGNGSDILLTLSPEINPDLEYANDINEAESKKLNYENILMNPIQSNASIEVNGVIPEINNESKIAIETNAIDGQILNDNSNFITIDNNPNQNQNTDDVVVFSSSTPTFRKLNIAQGSLISDTNTVQVNKDIERSFTETIKNRENDVPSYVNYINSHLHEPNSLLVVNEGDKNNAPKLSAKENVNAQSAYCSNIDSLVSSNHYNIPTVSTNRKEVPQIYAHNHNSYGYHVSIPYNYMYYQLIPNKPQLHYHHRWNFLQNGDVLKQNKSRFQSLDQLHKFEVREQWPYRFSQIISGGIDGHYDLQGHEQYSHGLTKPNINQNENLHTTDPVKYMLNPKILKPLLLDYKNIVKHLDPVTDSKTKSILDLSQIDLDDKYNQLNPQEVITTLFRETLSPNNMNRRNNYHDFIINSPDIAKEHPENYVDHNNPFECLDISSPITFLPYYPRTGKHFNGIYPNIASDVYHMLDPCTYKNILTLEGHGNLPAETTSTLANSRELTDKADTLLVDYKAPPSQPHSFGGFVPTYDHLHLPASTPSKLNINASPMNPYYNTYLSNLSQIGNKLTSLKSEIDLSNKDNYDNISNFKKPTIPIFSIDNDVPRTEKSRTLTINDKANNLLQKDCLVEPINKYINNIPQIPEYIGQSILLNKLGLSTSPLLYQTYSNQKPLVTNNSFRIPYQSHYLLPSKPKEKIKAFLPPKKLSYIGPYHYSTTGLKTQPLAHDVTVTGLPNNDNSIPMILNNALLPNVSLTVLNPYHEKVESSPKIVPPRTAYYPFASIPLKYIIPLKYTTTVSHADLSTNSISPFSIPGLIKQKPYASDAQYVPKLLPSKAESSTTDTQSSTANSSNLEPFTSKALTNKNVLPPSSILPLSTLMQDTHLHTPIYSSITHYPPIPTVKDFLPLNQYKTEPLLEKGNILNSYEPSPCYSESITPIQPFKASCDYVSLPLTITSIIPHLHPSKIPFYKASPQNVVVYVKFPSDSSSTPELMPSIKTQGTKSFTDTVNYPYYSNASPVNADLSSFIQSQNTISITPNSYKTNDNTLYSDKYTTFPKPISTNILQSQSYSDFLPTISSIEKPRSFKSNLDTKYTVHSPYYNLPSFEKEKPDTLSDQEFQKYVTRITNVENLSPDLVSSTNGKMHSHRTTDLNPLVFSSNYSLAPRFTHGNIDPWKLLNHNIIPKTQSRSNTVSPRVVLPIQGNVESVPLAISETLSLHKQDLNPINLNLSLSTKHNPHNSVQPCQYSENFGLSQNKVTWMAPCKSRKDVNQQVNCISNNFASIYQIPAVKPGFWSKEFPFRYAGHGLPTEIPKYGQFSQVTYLEPKPINKLANIDPLIAVTKLDLQPTTPTMATLGLQEQTNPVKDHLTEIKPLSNYVLPSLFLGSEKSKSAPFHTFIPSTSAYLQSEVSSTQANLNKMTYSFATSNTYPTYPTLPTLAKVNFVPPTTKMPLDSSSLAYQTYLSVSINDHINLQGSRPIISTLLNPKTSKISPKTISIWENLRKNHKFTPFISSDPIYARTHSELQQSIHALPVSSSLSTKVPYQSALDYSSGSAISLPSPSICSTSGPLLGKTLAPYFLTPDLTHDSNTWSSPSTTYNASSIPHTHIPTLAEKILDEAQLNPNNKLTRNKALVKAYDGNIEQSNVKIINQMNNNIKDYIEKSDEKNNVLNEKLIEIPLKKYIGIVQYETANCKVSYLKTDNPNIYLKVWPTAVKIIKPKVVLEIGKLEALNFCPMVKDKNIPYTNDEIQKLVEVFVKKYYGEPIIVTNSHKPHVAAYNIDENYMKDGKVYIVWANVCDCGCNRMGCHCINSNSN